MKNKTGSLVSKEYSLDRLGAKAVMRLPTAKSPAGSSDNLAQGSVPADLQEKVASLLASESSRKVGLAAIGHPDYTSDQILTSRQPFKILQKGKQCCPSITIVLALPCGIWWDGNSHQLIYI